MIDNPLHTLPDDPGPVIATASRRWFDVLNPRPDDVTLFDITTGLERIRRWTGQTQGYAPSVLEHSLHVHEVMVDLTTDRQLRACALLHDAHEAYVGDVSRPVKIAMARVWRSITEHPASSGDLVGLPDPWWVIEHRAQQAVLEHFGLADVFNADAALDTGAGLVAQADQLVLGYEANLLYGHGTAEAWGLPHASPPSKRTGANVTAFRFRSMVAHYTGISD